MDSGGWVAVLVLGVGLGGVAATEAVHRYQEHRRGTRPAQLDRVPWRSLVALEQAITEEAQHGTEVWQ